MKSIFDLDDKDILIVEYVDNIGLDVMSKKMFFRAKEDRPSMLKLIKGVYLAGTPIQLHFGPQELYDTIANAAGSTAHDGWLERVYGDIMALPETEAFFEAVNRIYARFQLYRKGERVTYRT